MRILISLYSYQQLLLSDILIIVILVGVNWYFFLKILFIYSLDTHRERQRQRRREKQAPCREPNVGLDPGTLGSGPGPKAGAQLLSHSGIPSVVFLRV